MEALKLKVGLYLEKSWLIKSLKSVIKGCHGTHYLFPFVQMVVRQQESLGKTRTAETYRTTLNSFMRFRKGEDISLDDIDSDLMIEYEAFLRSSGVTANSSSFYMRNLRSLYNRAVEKKLTVQNYPFKHVYTGIDKTVKRAISLDAVRQIKTMDLKDKPHLDFARDMFLFSFYTRGMSFIDMAYLHKSDLNKGVLSYRRRKTGQQLLIRWEPCMQDIVNKYFNHDSQYMLPIIKTSSSTDERKQYSYASHTVNRNLKKIGEELELDQALTMYVSRHTWASVAKSKNIPVSIISESMGHDSESTTRIYLTTLESHAIDDANDLILKSL